MSGLKRYRSVLADSARWEGFLFRAGDIVISTPPKCGTTWMQTLCAMLVLDAVAFSPPFAEISTRRILANRERGFRAHLAVIVPHLAPGVTIDDAVAVYTALVLPEVYRSLVTERGWSPERYERWLGGALIHDLLG